MRYLNLGCGSKFHPYWVNVDMYAADETVLVCNFLNGIPFKDNYFDVVYHSHVLEHFAPLNGKEFIDECFRILKPGGIIRIVLPDLEKIVNEYIKHLKRLDNNNLEARHDYDWIMLEMFDQTVRNNSGGEMIKYINNNMGNKEYVQYRIGHETNFQKSKEAIPNSIIEVINELKEDIKKHQVSNLAVNKLLGKLLNAKDRLLIKLLSHSVKEKLKIGEFRCNGEIHQWMYDRFSMKRLLDGCGFTEFVVRTAEESYINGWNEFKLDNPFENASLFVEAIKPA